MTFVRDLFSPPDPVVLPPPDPKLAEEEAAKKLQEATRRRRVAQGASFGLGMNQLTYPGMGITKQGS